MADKKYYIYLDHVPFEVSEAEYREYYREKEHSRYLRKEERKVTIVSYDEVAANLFGNEIIADETVNVEETAIQKVMLEKLRQALKTLDEDELFLIQQLIYQERSERALARQLKISHTAVGKRWDKLKEKLKKLLEI